MKIGILSDTHDNLPKIEKAVRFFIKKEVDFVLHAGDFIAPFTIPKFNSLSCDWSGVLGNNDGEKDGLFNISRGKIKKGPLRVKFDNIRITLVHDINKINFETEKADIIIFGHTHKPEIKKHDVRLLINPGECCGWLTGEATVALVDSTSLSGQIFKI